LVKKKHKLNNKSNQKIRLLLAIFTVIIIATSSVLIYNQLSENRVEDNNKEPEKKEVDNRISPLENQGLTLEIKRIRHRGLADKLMKFGRSWRNKPTFYFVGVIDEKEFSSDKTSLFTTWDTMNMQRRILRDVEEEKEASEVKLTIVERTTTGLIFKKTTDIQKDSFSVTYDYRTGRWSGDDNYKDNDGYGHYLGETFEIWFDIYQNDVDGDAIPYWTEVNILDTNPWKDDSKLDPDEDGIDTYWEWKWDYDPFTWDDHCELDPDIDGIENIEEYQMKKWLANPFSPDIYVEVDGMVKKNFLDPLHFLSKESQQFLIERFCRHGFNLYFDDGWPGGPVNGGGEILPWYTASAMADGVILQYYENHFADERKGIFRYLLCGGDQPAFTTPTKFNRQDGMHVVNHFKLDLGYKAFTKRTKNLVLAMLTQHEMGHSLGINPWTFEGCDNTSYNKGKQAAKEFKDTWGQYVSCMNYYYSCHFEKTRTFQMYDYSNGKNGPPYDQNDWEALYLPNFQMEGPVIEEYHYDNENAYVHEGSEFTPLGWVYDEGLSEKYLNDWLPSHPTKIKWLVFVKTDEATEISNRDIRIYALPDVGSTFAGITLSYEGSLSKDGNIELYSLQDIINDINS